MKTGTPDLVFEVLAKECLVVSCQTRFNPSDAEWDLWMTAASNLEHRVGTIKLLIISEGGHPTKEQLERLRSVNKTNPSTAIVSPSLALRFFAGALTFINPTIRCFSPKHLTDAFDHLDLLPSHRKLATESVERLQRQLTDLPATG